MKMRFLPLTLILLLTSCAEGPRNQQVDAPLSLPATNIVDLSYPFNAETIYWPTSPSFNRRVTDEGVTPQGYYYASGIVATSEHGGTHIDAPIHFAEGGQSVDQIPLSQLVGSAVVIDVSQHASANPDYQITIEDLQQWETERRPIPDGSIVLFRTGFGKFWPDRARYMGTAEIGAAAVANLHFPGLHPDAAQWLVDNRSIKAVGIDTPSIDYGQSQLFEAHQRLFEKNVPALENVANLDKLPIEGAAIVALPMKIEGGSGGPVRIIAFVP